MIDERERYERAFQQFEMPEPAWDRLNRRRDRKRRDQRIRAGILGLAIAIAVGWLGVNALRSMPPVPADDPTPAPPPAGVGALAYAVDGDFFVAEWDSSNPVKIADGRPPDEWEDGFLVEEHCGPGEYFAAGPIWSPDGRYLAYRHTDCDAPQDAWWDVVISDARGNVVTSFPSEGWGISWSPDSTRVAVWVHWGDAPWTIGVYGLDGERQMLLTLPFVIPAGESDPVWSPDGRSLLLGNFEIPLDGSTPRPLPWADGGVAGWALSPDGSRLALAVNKSFVIAEADGSNPQKVFGDWPGSLVWSPAGDRIAFTPTSRGSTQLRVLDVATGTATLLTEVDGSDKLSLIDFSPQGDRILFYMTEDEGAGARGLWSVNADGSDLRHLLAGTALGDWLTLTQTG